MRDASYLSIPGTRTHELPPLLVHHAPEHMPGAEVELASMMLEAEDMLSPNAADEEVIEQRKFELALQLKQQYENLLAHWLWGDSVVEWIRQCEITFEREVTLRSLLHPDVWPHASRASFVTLLQEKEVPTHGVAIEKAVGLRLTFRQPPPINCFSNHFLFFLNSTVADTAYHTWSTLIPRAAGLFPPERFHFEVVDIDE